ncbi:MAG TPA: hypothetical protein VJT49_34065 [Amycolatopsis sp.]|uniref:hypothetical protein n=1 Tax=Amycolatopsis sp. TaxID=37632 RepID=UPI002B478047|nr:hypothetical protein [Amycolatopsis sp.]HKS50049.1 hypothetical protein [Amycolatopsis sp.]
MGMIRVLVALHPKDWRARYGEEFGALLEDSRLTPLAVANVVIHAGRLRTRAHMTGILAAAAFLASVACNQAALRGGLADNILWAPTDLPRALLLLGTVGPWLALITGKLRGRRERHGHEPQHDRRD